MSLRDTGAMTLTAGSADLFLVGADGQRWPLITITAPMLLVGPAGGDVDLVVTGREGAALSSAQEPIGDITTALSPWWRALADAHPGHLSGPMPTDTAGVRARLAAVAADLVASRTAAQQESRDASVAAEARMLADTRSRLEQGVAHGGERGVDHDAGGDDPMVGVFRILGRHQGFTTRRPTGDNSSIDPVDAVASASGVRYRLVHLTDGWNTSASTPILAFMRDENGAVREPVALLPTRRGYQVQRAGDTKAHRISPAEVALLDPRAYQLYIPLPRDRPATRRDLIDLASRGTSWTWALIVFCSAVSALLALLTPVLTNAVLGFLVPEGARGPILAVGVALVVVAVSVGLVTMVQNLATSRLSQVGQLRVEAALWDRTLGLPLRFFRQYSSGDLVTRLMVVDQLRALLGSQTVTAILAAVFSLINFVLLFTYSVPLGVVALVVVGVTALVLIRTTRNVRELTREQLAAQRGAIAWVVQLIGGISKVRVAGAEDRLTALTMDIEARMIDAGAKQTLALGRLQSYLGAITAFAPLFFFLVAGTVLWGPTGPEISSSTFIAFMTAFGAVLGAIIGLVAAVPAVAMVSPALSLISPILDSVQEQSPNARPLTSLQGRLELRSVDFQYLPSTPPVLKDLSLTIAPGEFTAIVGPSGSGKTSILRILTGIEEPDSGQVLVDGHDLRDIDGDDYRRRIGAVIQSGGLTPGSILDNIAGGTVITEDEAWRAADAAAIADDIRAMPMKLHTRVTPATISGGQIQRILIARALARHPRVLLFDEATSELDNRTQDSVMTAIQRLPITRVVVAHRLSTVMSADRILVVVDGRIVQEGTYSSLIDREGVFAALAKRQLTEG